MHRPTGRTVFLAIALLFPSSLAGQGGVHPRWEIPGLDFHPDGVWRVRARAVRSWRHQLLARGDFAALNAPSVAPVPAGPAAAAVAGTIRVPAVLFSYQGIDSAQFMRDPAVYTAALFGVTPPPGIPYTLRSFYAEMSNGLLTVPGQAIGWARLTSVEESYNGGRSSICQARNPTGTSNCNGIFSGAAFAAMQDGLREALARVDPGVDFGQFDNDGPDGIPNSLDDDGFVDVIAFLHATRDGACTSAANNHLWAHRATLSYSTGDPSARGGTVGIRDYILQSALGGAGGCDTTQILPIGIMAHEFGHSLDLPDLYDTSNRSEGIGQWGLMGSGNWSSPRSPSRMEAWSLNEVGWITLRPVAGAGSYTLGPAPTADTALVISVQGANPRGELFLVENRQAVQADSAMIRAHCGQSGNPPGCGGGLLIWHVDSLKAGQAGGVNAGTPHGVALVQADGLAQLDLFPGAGGNRGDAGDAYPGVTGNRAFSFATTPASRTNADGNFAGVAIDSIRQLVPNGTMAFRVRVGGLTVVRASDTLAAVIVDGDTTTLFRDLLDDGAVVTVAVPDTQLSDPGRTRWRFVSWSNGQPRVHDLVASLAGQTVVANLARDFLLRVVTQGAGSVAATPAVDQSGTLFAEGTAVTLTAQPGPGQLFGGWIGDTTASGATLMLPMARPYTVTARFDAPLALASAPVRPGAVMGAGYDDTLRVTGGSGTTAWSIVAGALPPGLSLGAATGRIVGIPSVTGSFTFTAQAVSGSQTASGEFTLTVTAPTLATDAVVAHLVRGGALTADEARYLDLIGNRNGFLDVGDFRAWVDLTGAPLHATAAALLGRARP